jgi:hypothetical protein
VYAYDILRLLKGQGETLGIDPSLRSELHALVKHRDRSSGALVHLARITLQAPVTFEQTSEGFSAWMSRNVNGNNPAYLAVSVSFKERKVALSVLPTVEAHGVPAGSCERIGDEIVATMTFRGTPLRSVLRVPPGKPELALHVPSNVSRPAQDSETHASF